MTVSIVSPSAAAVKPRRHPRFRREDIPAPEIDPVLKAFGRHIARSFHRGRGVHTVSYTHLTLPTTTRV